MISVFVGVVSRILLSFSLLMCEHKYWVAEIHPSQKLLTGERLEDMLNASEYELVRTIGLFFSFTCVLTQELVTFPVPVEEHDDLWWGVLLLVFQHAMF